MKTKTHKDSLKKVPIHSVIGNFLRLSLWVLVFIQRWSNGLLFVFLEPLLSISVNGNVHGWFKGKRGLRQGDPLSPYLFTLVMEILTLLLQRKVRNSDEFQYHHLCEQQRIINLCFADDLFLFARGHPSWVSVIMDALEEFKEVFCPVPWHDLEQLMRGFLWCQREMKKGKAKLGLRDSVVCMPKHECGHWESLWFKGFIRYKLTVVVFGLPCRGDASWEAQKLKDTRTGSQWDVGPSIDLNLLKCPCNDMFPELHEHLIPVSVLFLRRNGRLFKKKTFTPGQIVDVIFSTVRLKLVTLKFKKMSTKSHLLLDQWNIPSYCIVHDGVTSTMCNESWGRNSFARAMIEISSDMELKESLVVAIPNLEGEEYTYETVSIEYEWTPLRCHVCKVFGHSHDQCPKVIKQESKITVKTNTDGFQTVRKRNATGNGKGNRVFTLLIAKILEQRTDQKIKEYEISNV
ncbi:putative reverse transcriptase domain, reverse transcriptase zinc-binding domain protein [Tanacetum coccineum]